MKQELEFREYNAELDQKFFDYIMDSCFNKNTVGLIETPTEESLNQISKDTIYEYLSTYFKPERMSVVGINIENEKLIKLCENIFDGNIQKIWNSDNFIKLPDDSIAKYTGGYSFVI